MVRAMCRARGTGRQRGQGWGRGRGQPRPAAGRARAAADPRSAGKARGGKRAGSGGARAAPSAPRAEPGTGGHGGRPRQRVRRALRLLRTFARSNLEARGGVTVSPPAAERLRVPAVSGPSPPEGAGSDRTGPAARPAAASHGAEGPAGRLETPVPHARCPVRQGVF